MRQSRCKKRIERALDVLAGAQAHNIRPAPAGVKHLVADINDAERFVWPISIIGIGTFMVLKQRKPVDVQYPGSEYKEI